MKCQSLFRTRGPQATARSTELNSHCRYAMLCNMFPILSLQLMKGSSFEQFFILKKKNVFFIIVFFFFFTIHGHDNHWSMTI